MPGNRGHQTAAELTAVTGELVQASSALEVDFDSPPQFVGQGKANTGREAVGGTGRLRSGGGGRRLGDL